MPTLVVRLGSECQEGPGHARNDIRDFLAKLRGLVALVGIASASASVELEVNLAGDLDENMEPIKISVHTDLTRMSRRLYTEWLSALAESIDAELAAAGVPRSVVTDFQLVLVLSGLSVGSVYRCNEDGPPQCITQWCAEGLKPQKARSAAMKGGVQV